MLRNSLPAMGMKSGRGSAEGARRILEQAADQLRTAGISQDEIDAHSQHMPAGYWDGIAAEDLLWHLQAVHDFFALLATPQSEGTTPVVRWRPPDPRSAQKETEVIVCTWDRRGLLAKVAGAFATVRLNILRARVFTRADNIALDVFRVKDPAHPSIDGARLQKVSILLESALQPPPTISFLTHLVASASTPAAEASRSPVLPTIDFNNSGSADCTILEVQAADRLGLLHDLLCVLADAELNVREALIDTQNQARDLFLLRDEHGKKLSEPAQLESLRSRLLFAASH